MPEFSSRDIDVIEGLEAIRRRPAMYIGPADGDHSLRSRLIELALTNAASDTPAPTEVRLTVWQGGAVTLAFDGEPFPVAPYSAGTAGIPHPELYQMFMYVAAAATTRSLSFGAAVINALSSRLVVSTVHHGNRYRAAFSRGGLVSLLMKTPTNEPHGRNVLTFEPDTEVVRGSMTASSLESRIRAAMTCPRPAIPINSPSRSAARASAPRA